MLGDYNNTPDAAFALPDNAAASNVIREEKLKDTSNSLQPRNENLFRNAVENDTSNSLNVSLFVQKLTLFFILNILEAR